MNLGWKIHVLDNNESADTDTSNSNSSTSNDGMITMITFLPSIPIRYLDNFILYTFDLISL